MGKELIKKAVRELAWRSCNRHLKHAHDLERLAPGAGELYLRRLAKTLDQLMEEELRRLRTSQSGQ